MFNRRYFQGGVALAWLLLLVACASEPAPAPAETPIVATPAAPTEAAEEAPGEAPTTAPSTATTAADYCVEKGGRVVTRHATYGIYSDPNEWLRLHGERQFCEFLEAEDGGEDGYRSRISIDLETLWSTAPTLATLAYYEPPAPPPPEPGVKLAFVYCTQLGGTANFGGQDNLAGGSWTTDESNSAENEQLIDHCLFPDQSTIDQSGLYDNANGRIAGLDLRTVLRYRPAQLGTPAHFCEFDAQPNTTADPDSHIAVDLDTLYSEEPTLAALAYLEPPPIGEVLAGVNPAPVYCSQLGGSSSPTGPDNAAGGGWVNEGEPVFTVMAMCIFADGSMIDEWGLTYHANSDVRGTDLRPILRYQPETVPDVFEG